MFSIFSFNDAKNMVLEHVNKADKEYGVLGAKTVPRNHANKNIAKDKTAKRNCFRFQMEG